MLIDRDLAILIFNDTDNVESLNLDDQLQVYLWVVEGMLNNAYGQVH